MIMFIFDMIDLDKNKRVLSQNLVDFFKKCTDLI